MAGGGRRLALLIGCSRYEHLPALPGPQHDVAAIKDVLEQQGDFECEVVADFQYTEIKKRISRFIRELQPADTGLLFYSGHGVTGLGTRKIYLCTYETSPDEPNVAGFSDDEVQEFIRPSKASALVVIIDSCYSGAFADLKGDGPGGVRHEFSGGGRGTIILAATDRRSTVPALTKGGSALSPFTDLVIEGLRGAADKDQPYVTAQGLATFLDKATKEHPELGLNPTWGGGGFNGPAIRIVRNPDVDLGNFPDAIRNALTSPDIYARMGAYFHIGQHARFDARLVDPARRLLDRFLAKEFGRVPGASDTIRSVLGWLDDAGRLSGQEERLRTAGTALTASQAELADAGRRNAELDKNLSDARRERDELKAALARPRDDLQQAEKERDETRARLASTTKRLQALEEAARGNDGGDVPMPVPSRWPRRAMVGVCVVAAVSLLLLLLAYGQNNRLQEGLDAANARAATADRARQAAEAARTTSEAGRMAAEAARRTAETARAAAEKERDDAKKKPDDTVVRIPTTVPGPAPDARATSATNNLLNLGGEPIAGPGVNCAKMAGSPLTDFICGNQDMWRDHLSLVIPFRAYWQSSREKGEIENDHYDFLKSVADKCLRPGVSDQKTCIRTEYAADRKWYLEQLSGDGRLEGQLAAEQAIQVQRLLRKKGYDIGAIDGNFGPNTRNAIMKWQATRGLPQTGLVSAAMLPQLEKDP